MGGPAFYTGTINIAKNEDWVVPLVYTVQDLMHMDVSGNEAMPMAPFDLTGSIFMMQIRKIDADNTAVVDVQSGDGIEITDLSAGEFTITITRQKLSRLHPGEYVADLVRIAPDGARERMIDAQVIVVEGTTRGQPRT